MWRFARVFAADPDKKHAEYMKETIADKFANVSTLDRKDLWAYLVGEKESSAKIDITMATVVPRFQVSHVDIFTGDFGGNAADLQPSQTVSNDSL